MYQNIFTTSFCRKLKKHVIEGRSLGFYDDKLSPKLLCIPHNPDEDILVNKNIQSDSQIELKMPKDGNNHDFENARTLHSGLQLTVTQATDLRLWTYLSHVQFWKYMRVRFPAGRIDSEKKTQYILDHWFVNVLNPRNISRHGVALLWWGAHLTYSDEREYALTKEFFSMLDYTRTIMAGSLGRNKNFRLAMLEFIVDNKDEVFSQYKEGRVRYLMRKLNYLAGYRMLVSLKKEEIKSLLLGYKEELKQVKSGR